MFSSLVESSLDLFRNFLILCAPVLPVILQYCITVHAYRQFDSHFLQP